jgi:hypothetical protein
MNYTIWYPQGAGGMWLNYLLWCNQTRTTLPGAFQSFEFDNLKQQWPEYRSFFVWVPHDTEQAKGNAARIRLGGHAWFNFYLNIFNKKNAGDLIYYGCAASLLKILNNNVWPNLYWQDLITDPEKFLADLSAIVGYHIPYDDITQRAIEQYIDSCTFPKLDLDFQSSEIYTEWARAVHDIKSIRGADEILAITSEWYCCPD